MGRTLGMEGGWDRRMKEAMRWASLPRRASVQTSLRGHMVRVWMSLAVAFKCAGRKEGSERQVSWSVLSRWQISAMVREEPGLPTAARAITAARLLAHSLEG